MKKRRFYIVGFAAMCIVLSAVAFWSTDDSKVEFASLTLADVEARTDCEAIDGYPNDGHCVKDDVNNYFCKSPGFLQSKNCRQSTAH